MAAISILSIDAWGSPDGWQWNAWHKIGTIDSDELDKLDTDEKIVAWLADNGFLASGLVVGKTVEIDDDQYNIVICDPTVIDAPDDCDDSDRCDHQHSAMPVIAIAYGEAY